MKKEQKQMVVENIPIVLHIAKKYKGTGTDFEDLKSAGTLGLCKAAENFNPEKGISFYTYAARVVENEILMELRRKRKTTKEVSIFQEIGEGTLLQDVIPDAKDPYEEFHKDAVEHMKAEEIIDSCRYLDEREKMVLKKQYLERKNQTQIGEYIGISQTGVSRISRLAKSKLRSYYAKAYA